MRLAFLTFGVLRDAPGSAVARDFHARIGAAFAAAEASPGFLDRAADHIEDPYMPEDDPRWGRWGAYRLPAMYPGDPTDIATTREAMTLSIWRDIESVFTFAYTGLHLDALRQKTDWFEHRRWPTYVAWWIGDDDQPTWADAVAHLERLHAEGPSAAAFEFHHPFDAAGNPVPRPALRRGAAETEAVVDPAPG